MSDIISVILIGTGATVVMDIWALLRRSLFGMPLANYALVGRWVAHMRHGQFHHDNITAAPAVRYEGVFGWAIHYLIGIVFAAGLVVVSGRAWIDNPTLLPALLFGIVTILAPFLLMQPGMGAGIASSRTPNPNMARLQSFITHTVFGFGLYITALTLRLLVSG